jgi:hypothetical protein
VEQQFVMRATGISKYDTLRRYENISDTVIVEQIKEKNPKPQSVMKKTDDTPLDDDFENDFNDDF